MYFETDITYYKTAKITNVKNIQWVRWIQNNHKVPLISVDSLGAVSSVGSDSDYYIFNEKLEFCELFKGSEFTELRQVSYGW